LHRPHSARGATAVSVAAARRAAIHIAESATTLVEISTPTAVSGSLALPE